MKIDLKEIREKFFLTKGHYSDTGGSYFTVENIEATIKEVWNTAVDECKKLQDAKYLSLIHI